MIVPRCFYRVLGILFFPFVILNSIHAQSDFFADQTEGCTNFKVKFTTDFSAVNPDTIHSVKWYFGFGDTISSSNPDPITYTKEGKYTVVMVINNHKKSAVVKTDYIIVHKTVQSVFNSEEFAPDYNYKFIPIDSITDKVSTYNYTWTYENVLNSTTVVHNRSVKYQTFSQATDTFSLDTGEFRVTLRITDPYGCVSQSEKIYTITDPIAIPNVFVPTVHQFYQIDPQDMSIVLLFRLYNRNGLLVFQQEAPLISWNGQTSSGKDLNTGVYYYILEASEGDPLKRYSKKGFIHLYR
jgi:PKD repeat protein